MKRALVTGAGGFIGHHLVNYLKEKGYWVRAVDVKDPEFEETQADQFILRDLRIPYNADYVMDIYPYEFDEVYALAADMGGMGFISKNWADIFRDNSRINTNTIDSAVRYNAKRYLFTSSACVYPEFLQEDTDVAGLKESDAFPAQPQDSYGWEKLFGELSCQFYHKQYGLETRVVRFHNIFGPLGTWIGGREKVPAAMCRKIAAASVTENEEIEIWGDGEQTRSFCFITDCVRGIYDLMQSDISEPINLGQDRIISINQLVDIIASIAGIPIVKKHIDGPQGVRGRNSDNTMVQEKLGWYPHVTLEEGLRYTYSWIVWQVDKYVTDGHLQDLLDNREAKIGNQKLFI